MHIAASPVLRATAGQHRTAPRVPPKLQLRPPAQQAACPPCRGVPLRVQRGGRNPAAGASSTAAAAPGTPLPARAGWARQRCCGGSRPRPRMPCNPRAQPAGCATPGLLSVPAATQSQPPPSQRCLQRGHCARPLRRRPCWCASSIYTYIKDAPPPGRSCFASAGASVLRLLLSARCSYGASRGSVAAASPAASPAACRASPRCTWSSARLRGR